MTKKTLGQLVLLVVLIAVVVAYFKLDLDQTLSLETLKQKQTALKELFNAEPFEVAGLYFIIYLLATAVSIPGALILTLAGGAIFGVLYGTILVSFASTIGATLAFLGSRYLFKDFVQSKFGDKLESFNKGFEREGAFYLLALRLVPVFPFFLINLLMGLTAIRVLPFFIVSQIGMFGGTLVYVNAGTELSKLDSVNDIASPSLLFSFALIGLLPIALRFAISYFRGNKNLRKFKKPKKFDFNLVVIGAGSAGLVSAYIAATVKAKVALIEKHKMGGDCLNTGCVPSKALIRSAKIMNYVRRAKEFGIEVGTPQANFEKVMERVQSVIKSIEPHDSVDRYTKLGVDCIQGEAQIRTPYEVEVNGKTLTTKNIIIATGASPSVPPISGLREAGYYTSDTIWTLKALPKRLVILGGGAIGCELAQAFARLGSEVVQVEQGDRIMGREDIEVSSLITKRFEREGIKVLTGHKASRVEKNEAEKIVICELQGKEVRVPCDQILVALGRRANVKGFGLENLGVEISDKGTVATDDYLRTTNYPNIYTCGDVAGPFQFTHTASHQAWFAAVNALFSPFKKFRADYRVIPWATFTDPEVARVGLNETEAKEKGIAYRVTRYELDDLDRAITESETHGFVKVLTPATGDKILGATIVGTHAGEIICEYVAAMKHGFGLNKILSTIHIYPTMAEANKYAAGAWKRATAPEKLLGWVEKFHAWRR